MIRPRNGAHSVERSVTHFGLARRGFARSFTRAQPLARTFRSQPYSLIEIAANLNGRNIVTFNPKRTLRFHGHAIKGSERVAAVLMEGVLQGTALGPLNLADRPGEDSRWPNEGQIDVDATVDLEKTIFIKRADVAQLVEQLIRNQQVSGSNPLVGSRRTIVARGVNRWVAVRRWICATRPRLVSRRRRRPIRRPIRPRRGDVPIGRTAFVDRTPNRIDTRGRCSRIFTIAF